MSEIPPLASGALAQRTFPPKPSQRTFLPQSRRAQLASLVWTVVWKLLACWTPGWCNSWRILLLRLFGARIAWSVWVAPSVRIRFPWKLTVGFGTIIHHRVIIDCMGRVRIGSHVRISQYSHLCAGSHNYIDPHMAIRRGPITVGDQVWIAADAFVGPNVTIGDRTIVGARAGVFKNLPASVVAVGDNAHPIRKRETEQVGRPDGSGEEFGVVIPGLR